jgi:predicted nucleic acid-binding protein
MTLYDVAFLACSEYCQAEFWTAAQVLVKSLLPCPKYVYTAGAEEWIQ